MVIIIVKETLWAFCQFPTKKLKFRNKIISTYPGYRLEWIGVSTKGGISNWNADLEYISVENNLNEGKKEELPGG